MNITHIEPFSVMGREVRTSNAREVSGRGSIGSLWGQIKPGSGAPVAVYSEYQSDKNGEYNYLLGAKIDADATLRPDLSRRNISGGRYLCLKGEGPAGPEMVAGLWREIWALEESGQLERAYQTDFEIYDSNGMELYVGVKEVTA